MEVCQIGSETVTLSRFRSPVEVPNRQPGSNEQSACSARAPKGYRSDPRPRKQLELLERLKRLEQDFSQSNGWNHWNRLLLGVFKAMEGLNPQVKRKILSDNPRRFYGI